MRVYLALALAALVLSTPINVRDMKEEDILADSDDFTAEVQGANNNTYVIVFHADDSADHTTDLVAALKAANEDDVCKQYDIFQDDYKNENEILVGQIDVRDRSNFKPTLELFDMEDQSDFKMTLPVVLISRSGNGYLGAWNNWTDKDDKTKLDQAFRDKLLKVSKAKKKRASEGGATEEPAGRR